MSISIAALLAIAHPAFTSTKSVFNRPTTDADKVAEYVERSETPTIAGEQSPSMSRRAMIAKRNEEHLVRLMHSRKLFPFRHRRIVAYAGMKYNAKGKPKIREMISRLEDLGVNCYSYLIDDHSASELRSLPQFCRIASKAGIEVWVVLVPPTEEPGLHPSSKSGVRYPPYGLDYLRWAKAIGEISRRHRNLTLLMIDDFLYNVDYFTPAYVKKLYGILKRENRKLLFGVTIYEDQLNRGKEIEQYLPYIGAVEWGYQHKARLFPNYGKSAASLPENISEFSKMFPNALLIPCLYFTPHSSWSRKATPSYLEEATATAYKQAGNVLVFRTPFKGTANYEIVKKFCREHHVLHGQ